MDSEAFRNKKSFEHSPKSSKHSNYKLFNDSTIKTCKTLKGDKTILLVGATIRKKYTEFKSAIHFG